MKTLKLEVVVKNVELAREIAAKSKVKIVSEKLISVCTLMVLEGDFDSLIDFNDDFFFEANRELHANYFKEIMALEAK
ncbi:hypothetical protein PP422_gp182 [Enterobacter phage vB_EhoM-IME523]|uniref:Uncharacterized protein n=1 Tax=Enterobacter phage vB_EhoM-IME523 TaxID=2596709 RepID=A0A7G3KA89_9CAUD|nr:hypothetical protein PP422_gp182 [Enterobacter phage vB_EhoM-IME523]YP_010650803.1 hypothetical protein PP425_gp189 [Enterobacter phage vB_EclM_Q7622]QEA10732.1 hypothetical protein [Enterobacter phage vB_EhoM-IME523]UIS65778.1 hypothetical protein Q76222_00271 [Enterobacter phage vB_EclM_Q7622]